ncbi:Snf7-domain-containing protein [Baffinella frigidus]|nr:Snf7-domain-containing protein [Cryptophyta sp. CCMP2293]
MGNLLGKKGGGKGAVKAGKAAPKVSEADRAVLQLKMQRDKMLQGRKKVLSVMARETEIAKALLKEGKKDRAKLALKKRKMQEKMLENHDAQMERMEEMIEGVEQAQREKKLFEVMQMGNQALKDMQKELSLEDVENLMEETQEAVAYQKQIEELLSEQLAPIDLEVSKP